jgi:hypothetical protein
MDFRSFKTDMKIDLMLIDPDGDNETLSGSGVDMDGYDGVMFLAATRRGEAGDIVLKAQQDSASNFATAADLEGTSVTMSIATSTDAFCGIEIKNPRERYVRPQLVIPNLGTARAVAVFAIRYGGKYLPETNSAIELHVNPAEGTA